MAGSDDPLSIPGLTLRLLGGLAAGLGVLGFVVLVGGGISWVRAFELHLPADQAVYARPKFELVTIGAVSGVAFLVGGALVVAAVYALAERALKRTFAVIAAVEVVIAALIGVGGGGLVVCALVAVALAAIGYLIADRQRRERFFVVAVVVFLGVVLYGCVAAYEHNRFAPQAQAAAVLLRSGKVLDGVYLARDDDRVLLGRLTPAPRGGCPLDHGVARMLELPQDQVANFALGPVEDVCAALRRTATLDADLRRPELKPPPAPPKP